MSKAKVNRTLDYMLSARIRGEVAAQGLPVSKVCEYAKVGHTTLYRLYERPTEYFPQTLRLMRNLMIPIEEVRSMICYPW